jgi:hypothetical protein
VKNHDVASLIQTPRAAVEPLHEVDSTHRR